MAGRITAERGASNMAELLDFSRPHLLRDDMEYERALAEIEALLDSNPEPFTDAYERMEFLSVLSEKYEDENFPVEDLTPQQLVDFMLEQKGLDRSDLHVVMGGRSRVSEFFSGKRPLSLEQIKGLHELLSIPADLLISAA